MSVCIPKTANGDSLTHCLRIVEANPRKFNLDATELGIRKAFITSTRQVVRVRNVALGWEQEEVAWGRKAGGVIKWLNKGNLVAISTMNWRAENKPDTCSLSGFIVFPLCSLLGLPIWVWGISSFAAATSSKSSQLSYNSKPEPIVSGKEG